MRWVLVIVLALAGFGRPAAAAELVEAIPGYCVAGIAPFDHIGPGIAGGALEAAPRVQPCDGAPMRLFHVEGADDWALELRWPRLTQMDGIHHAIQCRTEVLPDGEDYVSGDRLGAWLLGPTSDYAHGILGDAIEASGFCVAIEKQKRALEFMLPAGSVFEDLRVRLVDLTGDGRSEFVAIRSYLDRGAVLAVYHLVEGRIAHLAETPAIGIPNRWLNPAGAADFDGDGRVEIAYVETPHIGGTLRVWELRDGALQEEHAVEGFSNHAIGSRELDLSAVLDWNADGVPDLALPDATRRTLRVVSFAGGKVAELDRFTQDAEITTAILATDLDSDGKPELLYGLADGRLLLARP